VRAQEYDKARAELAKATKLRPRLTTDDREAVDERIATIRSGLRR
jgi:hypothetical protein